MKILVIRFSSIGDIVLSTPVWRCLKKQLPEAEVHLVTKHSFKMVTASSPYIDKFHYYHDDLHTLIKELHNEQYDYVIDLHNNFRSRKIRQSLHKKSFIVDKLNMEKFLLTQLNIDVMPRIHFTQRCLKTVAPLGVKDDGFGLDYFIPGEDVVPEQDIPAAHHAGFIAIVIGATYTTKRLPVHKLQELCMKIQHPIILLGGKMDHELGAQVASGDKVKIYNACGKFNLNESADLVRKSKLVVTHDTGLMHIAAALQKPVISIWGNTVPLFGMYPFYGRNSQQQYTITEVKGLRCRPCSKLGYDKCPLEHFKCMEDQDIDALVNTIHQRIRK